MNSFFQIRLGRSFFTTYEFKTKNEIIAFLKNLLKARNYGYYRYISGYENDIYIKNNQLYMYNNMIELDIKPPKQFHKKVQYISIVSFGDVTITKVFINLNIKEKFYYKVSIDSIGRVYRRELYPESDKPNHCVSGNVGQNGGYAYVSNISFDHAEQIAKAIVAKKPYKHLINLKKTKRQFNDNLEFIEL